MNEILRNESCLPGPSSEEVNIETWQESAQDESNAEDSDPQPNSKIYAEKPTLSTKEEIEDLTAKLNDIKCSEGDEEVYWQTAEWKSKKHIFVLSSAGKPIYSR